jgi:hypothetical protein
MCEHLFFTEESFTLQEQRNKEKGRSVTAECSRLRPQQRRKTPGHAYCAEPRSVPDVVAPVFRRSPSGALLVIGEGNFMLAFIGFGLVL